MRIVRYVAAAVFGLILIGALAGYVWVRHDLREQREKRIAEISAALAAHGAQVMEDQKLAAALPVFARREGARDAGGFLNPRLDWSGDPARLAAYRALHGGAAALALREDLRKRMQDSWLKADPSLWAGLDFGWMRELAGYDFWDLEHDSPIAGIEARDFILAPLPKFPDLIAWSRLRIVKGLHDGDAAAARQEVSELARLCFSTETLLGEMIGIALLRAEDEARAARPEAADWKTLDDTARDRLRRAIWAAPAFVQLDAPESAAAQFAQLPVGRCAALSEVGHFALAMRPLAGSSRAPAYARLASQLAGANDCRLASLRGAFAAPDPPGLGRSICGVTGGRNCRALEWSARVPGVRSMLGELLIGLSEPNWFRFYEQH